MEQKILLIDDSAILRRIATNVLHSRHGCGEVITATRATEGFARACASDVSLILVDYHLAGQPDAVFCRRLLEEPRTSRVPVVLLLGRGMTPPAPGSLPENIVDFLVKPFTPEQLVSTVKAVTEKAKPGHSTARPEEEKEPSHSLRTRKLSDHHEVAAAVSAAAFARRETNRIQSGRMATTLTANSAASVSDACRGPADPRSAKLRTALSVAAARLETGVFRVRAANSPAIEVYLENGQVIVVATQDAERYSKDADGVMPPKISPAMLDEAVNEQAQSGVPFLLTLGSRGLLSKSAAVALLHRFGQQHFARLWNAPPHTLSIEFVALDALPGFALRLEPRRESVDEWLLGTLRHLQTKDIAARVKHESYGGIVTLQKKGADDVPGLRLDDQEREFRRLMEVHRDLQATAKAMEITVDHAFLLLFRFRSLEIMDYRPRPSAFVVTPRTNVRRVLPLQR